ncbi:MAG: large subunit ribosomal protein [Patescibacteria group bacterium]|jgi:large subunit ribosomal protein L22|nr:large subunit ribosomal protein [Patescibacteria group bacterium]
MKASLKNYRQSPRKVRLVGDLLKGKSVVVAQTELRNLIKRASLPMMKLLDSAVANAKLQGMDINNLVIANVTVNKGLVMKRSMPRARGSASRINKRTSHVLLTLKEVGSKDGAKKVAKKVAVKKAPKAKVLKAKKEDK